VEQSGWGLKVEYLNRDYLAAISPKTFRYQHPYPWLKMQKVLTDEGFTRLCENMPDVALFTRDEGQKRAYGQAPHDRYSLHYWPGLKLPHPWMEFLAELQGETYQIFLRRMLGARSFLPTFEWHYAWQGCSVSPHCDAARKIATHLFYFNAEDWDPAWGGQTLILDGGSRFRTHSAPGFDQLKVTASSEPCGNNSLLFQRTPHSWHGVRPLNCPPGIMRRLFKVTVNALTLQVWWRKMRGKDPDGYRARVAA
jgi:2-oxoglutarate-Fe(II)-dependent oxygenase superfamily protein